jgi:hypothetical protein
MLLKAAAGRFRDEPQLWNSAPPASLLMASAETLFASGGPPAVKRKKVVAIALGCA